jgi:cytochrome c oxidase assembly protein subunit 15
MTNSRLINPKNNNRLFQKLALLTVIVVYVLILIGGIVRSTGSGMGCPDWPKCFGSWVPPTDKSQLPANYQEIFGAKLKGEVEFNVYKTWTEYLNRLFGAFTGLLIFGTLLASIPFLKRDRSIFYMSLLAFLLVGFEGWLGSKVVSTELAPVLVTLHMLLAIVIVFVLITSMARSFIGYVSIGEIKQKKFINSWLLWTLVLTLLQVLIGTQVREELDGAIKELGNSSRGQWIENLGIKFYVHRSYSIIILLLHIGLLYWLRRNEVSKGIIYKLSSALFLLIIVEIATGIIMAYFSVPAFAQPIHLTLATVALGIQFVLLLFINADRVLNRDVQLIEI